MKYRSIIALFGLLSSVQPGSAQLAQGALGVWADEDGQSNIEIAPCGDDLCGRIVWLKEPFDASGKAQTDINNPDPSLRQPSW